MKFKRLLGMLLPCYAMIVVAGCVTTTTKNGRVIPNEPSALSKQWSKVKRSTSQFVDSITPKDTVEPIVWRWSTGIPQAVTKSESIKSTVPLDAVAVFAPDADVSAIQLASTAQQPQIPITVVNDAQVHTLAELHTGIVEAVENSSDEEAVIEFAVGSTADQSMPVKISRNNLIALEHASLPDRSPIRVVEDANPWVLLKDDGVRCKLMLRTEENSKLVHVAMSLKVCWGQSVTLPRDLHVFCEGKELDCLTVAETLQRTYGDLPGKLKQESDGDLKTYNDIASADEYLIPVNYRDLEAKHAAEYRFAAFRPMPAFAVVGGYTYPGPPVLGDARALGSFMLQPREYNVDEETHVGWVVFDASSVNAAENFEVTVDLGSGPQTVRFRIPKVGA